MWLLMLNCLHIVETPGGERGGSMLDQYGRTIEKSAVSTLQKTSFLQSHHKKHQFYALARRLFTYFHLRNDDSSAPVRVPRPSEMPYFWAFSALLPCHQSYGLNMARVVLLHRHTTEHAHPLCEKNIDTIFLAQGNMSAYFLA